MHRTHGFATDFLWPKEKAMGKWWRSDDTVLSENPYTGFFVRKDWPLKEAMNMHFVRLQQVSRQGDPRSLSDWYNWYSGGSGQQEDGLHSLEVGGGAHCPHYGSLPTPVHNSYQGRYQKLFVNSSSQIQHLKSLMNICFKFLICFFFWSGLGLSLLCFCVEILIGKLFRNKEIMK